MENGVVFPSDRYIPVVSIVMATFCLSSLDIRDSSLVTSWSSGASIMKSSPMSFRLFVMETPQLNKTILFVLLPLTDVFSSSVALMFMRGLSMSPVNSSHEPSAMVNVFSGMIGRAYFISP